MIVNETMDQHSEEWFNIRKGRPTASQFSNIITPKGALSKSSGPYMSELIAECYYETISDFMGNVYTDRGNELEPDAREAFSEILGEEIHEVGFVTRDDTIVGCSPDGLIKDADGNWSKGVEVKCPIPKTHVKYWFHACQCKDFYEKEVNGLVFRIYTSNDALPDYHQQVHGSLAVTGLNAWYFISYCPGMMPLIVEVTPDDYTEKVSDSLDDFLIEYQGKRSVVMPLLTVNRREEVA